MSTKSNNKDTVTGQVIEALPNLAFMVELEDGTVLRAYLAGKMKLYRIKVLIGDQVEVLKNQYDGPSRIVRRLDPRRNQSQALAK